MSDNNNNNRGNKKDNFSINMFNKKMSVNKAREDTDDLEAFFQNANFDSPDTKEDTFGYDKGIKEQAFYEQGADVGKKNSTNDFASYTPQNTKNPQSSSHGSNQSRNNQAQRRRDDEDTLLFEKTRNSSMNPSGVSKRRSNTELDDISPEMARSRSVSLNDLKYNDNDPTIVMKKENISREVKQSSKKTPIKKKPETKLGALMGGVKDKLTEAKGSIEEKYPKLKNNDKNKKNSKIPDKKKKTIKLILKYALLFLCVCFLGGCIFVFTIYLQAPDIDYDRFKYISSSQVLDQDGTYYESLQGMENREPVSITEVPQVVQLAFVSIEDQRFYSHGGVDLRGTAKAILSVVLKGNLDGPGGSTITQQLLKLTHLSDVSSLKRKIYEWKMAPELENKMTKQEILGAYLNKVNMSQAWGVQAAAKYYFGVEAKNLSIAQAAVLASIINSPTYYNPLVYDTDASGNVTLRKTVNADKSVTVAYNENNMDRALIVVDQMYTFGHISKAEKDIAVDQLKNNKIGLVEPADSEVYSYFTDSVYTEVMKDLQSEKNMTEDEASDYLLNKGLKIYSTVDPAIQKSLEKNAAVNKYFPTQSSTAKSASAAMTKSTGKKVEYIPQVAMTVVENKTGYVKGILGGRTKTTNLSMNRGLQYFQTGSSTKPLTTYGPGIDSGKITLATAFDDIRIDVNGWRPTNSGGGQSGMCTIRRGLRSSLNTIAVQAYFATGWETILPYAQKLGLNIVTEGDATDLNPAALALGGYTQGQTTLAMASAFTTFPNGGYRMDPTFYTKVVDNDGNVVLEKKQERTEVWQEGTAWLITSVLKQAVTGGTTYVSIPGQEVAGKTGTTDSERCAWFCGYTPQYTAAVWYGYDQNIVSVDGRTYILNINVFGGATRGPSTFWEACFRDFYKEKKIESAKMPDKPKSVVSLSVDSVSGKAPSELSSKDPRGSKVISEYFLEQFPPAGTDDMHVECTCCARTKLYAGEYCPASCTYTMVLLRKTDERFPSPIKSLKKDYSVAKEKAILAPADGKFCTYHTANTANGLEILSSSTPISSLNLSNSSKTVTARLTTASGNPILISGNTTLSASASNGCVSVSTSGANITITPNYSGNCTVTITASTPFKNSVAYKGSQWYEAFTYTLNVSTSGSPSYTSPTITLTKNGSTLGSTDSGTAGSYTLPQWSISDDYSTGLGMASIVIKDSSGNTYSSAANMTNPGTYTVTYTTQTNAHGQKGTKTITVTLN